MAPDRSIAVILEDIAWRLQEILRTEMRFAKVEMVADLWVVLRAGLWLVIGAGCVCIAMVFALGSAVQVLALAMPSWAAELLVSVAVGACGVWLGICGRRQLRRLTLFPNRTLGSISEVLQRTNPPDQ